MYHFIVNPKSSSGKGIRYWHKVKDVLDKREIPYNAVFTRNIGHAIEIAEEICIKNEGIKNIVILGGDGTINEVINGIHSYKDVLLGYVPSGSSNDLARSLKISRNPEEALHRILSPLKFMYLDHGIIDFPDRGTKSRKFACSSGIGYDANVCNEVAISPLKKSLNRFGAGKFVYIAIALKQILTLKPCSATVVVDENNKKTYHKVLLIASMIHKFEGGGLIMAPHADPTDGKLSVCIVHGLSKLKVFILMPTIFFGKHVNVKGVESFNCSTIDIITDRELAVHTDGEVADICSHIKVSIIPEQIRMIL